MERRRTGPDRRRAERNTVYRDKQLVIRRTSSPRGLRFVGAVDAFNVKPVEEILAASMNRQGEHDVHVYLTELEFMDVSGIRALVAAAERADGRHRMILHGLPPLMSRVMSVVGWSDLPALVIAETEAFEAADGEVGNLSS